MIEEATLDTSAASEPLLISDTAVFSGAVMNLDAGVVSKATLLLEATVISEALQDSEVIVSEAVIVSQAVVSSGTKLY